MKAVPVLLGAFLLVAVTFVPGETVPHTEPTTWGEVVPVLESGTILLLSVGLVGMTFRRLGTRTGIAALGLCSLVLGCAKCDYPLVPVAGTVTVAGKPVANVAVQFQPIGQKGRDPGPGSVGVTDAAGHYQAKLIDADHDLDGAVVGRHRVRFVTVGSRASLDLSGPVRSVLPPGQEGKEIEFDVPPGGTAQADFAFPMK